VEVADQFFVPELPVIEAAPSIPSLGATATNVSEASVDTAGLTTVAPALGNSGESGMPISGGVEVVNVSATDAAGNTTSGGDGAGEGVQETLAKSTANDGSLQVLSVDGGIKMPEEDGLASE
jgi:hypothetical protein